jgi:hypothetical protein
MPFLFASAFLLLIAYPMIGTTAVVWVLAASQLILLVREVRSGQVVGAGGFIFMSFLFFAIRPIYLVLEKDHKLLIAGYQIRPSTEMIGSAMWWASAALWCFAIGVYAVPRFRRRWLERRNRASRAESPRTYFNDQVARGLVVLQVLTLPIIYLIASRAGRTVYRSGFGAYMYDLPVPLHAVHVFAVVVMLGCWIKRKNVQTLGLLIASGILLLIFTWLMREVTVFRGFYVTGIMMAAIAGLHLWKRRVGYAWLILPVILLQPFFQYLGGERAKANEDLVEAGVIDEVFKHETLLESYWDFYRSNGDMNIFDTFVAAKQFEPAWHPYAWSWLYVPLHFIPRAVWQGKPERGVTIDGRFSKGLPTSPGIAGFSLLDGGLTWMLISMAVLGYLVSLADWYVLTMRRGILQSCLIAILVVTAMFLSRVFLWQYFYQVLYYLVPVLILYWWAGKMSTGPIRRRRAISNPSHGAPLPAR